MGGGTENRMRQAHGSTLDEAMSNEGATKGEWRVHGHGPLEMLEENLWHVEADVPGMPMKRRMVAVRLASGALVVHSAVCMDDQRQRELDAWGPVEFIVVPNGWHRLDARAYAARYPNARVVCPDLARKLVAKRVRVDGNLSLVPSDPALACQVLAGSSIGEHVLCVTSNGRVTLVFNDTVFNLPKLPGFKGFVYGLVGSTGAPKVTPLMRMVSVRDKAALRAQLEKLAATPGLFRVIPGHGAIVEGESESRAMLESVAAGL